jgi:ribonuclease-3
MADRTMGGGEGTTPSARPQGKPPGRRESPSRAGARPGGRNDRIAGYLFRNPALPLQALTHRSFLNEEKDTLGGDNERLEYLGDAVLQLAVTDFLYHHHPELDEGELSKRRSALVSEDSLAAAAELLRLGSRLRLGRGEETGGGRSRPSILASCLEALLGAVYLDGGYDAARKVVAGWLKKFLKVGATQRLFRSDYKSRLQELAQVRFRHSPSYVLIQEEGLPHEKYFKVGVMLEGAYRGYGRGRSKKEAEQRAARMALRSLESPR